MLRPFPPANATRTELVPYQIDSDALLRPIVSSLYVPSQLSSAASSYKNASALSALSNLSSELLEKVADGNRISQQMAADSVSDSNFNDEKMNLGKGMDKKNTSKDNILAMIFKIVPIGINIAKRGKTIVAGLKETSMGIVNLIKNAAILTAIIGIDTINFFMQLFIFMFKLLLCSVTIISNFPKCVVFYFIDVLMFFVFICIISVLFMIDMFLLVKTWAGISCVEMFLMLLMILEEIDKTVYSAVSVHIIHYPDSINKLCYTCSAMGDTSGFKNAASRIFRDIFIKLPSDIGGPIGEFITGIGHIFSFLNLG